MSVYLPEHLAVLGPLLVALAATLLLGLAITRIPVAVGRWLAWALVVGSVVAVERFTAEEPAGFRMVAIMVALLWAMKVVVSVESHAAGQPRLTPGRWLAFATLWPGMRPAPFTSAGGPPRSGAGRLLGVGAQRLVLGFVLCTLARQVGPSPHLGLPQSAARLGATLLLLVGLSLVLHFGLFSLLAGAWRLAGVECRPLFRAPLRARSLTEFWGQRWNLAFSQMTALAVYRPLTARGGKTLATLGAFAFSGLLHELAISVPVRAGYGLPMLYFILHGVLVLGERRLAGAGHPVDRPAWLGRLWTLGWLVVPLPMLFHLPFLKGVVWPLLGKGD